VRQTRSATNGKMKNCVATMVYHLFILMPFNFFYFNGYVEQHYGIHKTIIHKLVYQEITTHTNTHTHTHLQDAYYSVFLPISQNYFFVGEHIKTGKP
jgi:hypothetical protein